MTQAIHSTVVLLVNPAAAGGRGKEVGDSARRELVRHGFDVELVRSVDGDDFAARARAAALMRASVVAVVGGDGSVQRAVDALARSETSLALIPCGRGNDLARALGIPYDTAAAVDVIARGRSQSIDLGRLGDTHFATVATLGFDACVAGIVHRREVPGTGTVAYGLGVLKGLWSYRPIRATLEGDFGEIEGRFFLVASANTRYYGAGLMIAPDARPDDGMLDIVVVGELGRATVLRVLPRLFTGSHVYHPAVSVYRTRELIIHSDEKLPMYADGEPLGSAPTRVSMAVRALRVVVPGDSVIPALITAASPA